MLNVRFLSIESLPVNIYTSARVFQTRGFQKKALPATVIGGVANREVPELYFAQALSIEEAQLTKIAALGGCLDKEKYFDMMQPEVEYKRMAALGITENFTGTLEALYEDVQYHWQYDDWVSSAWQATNGCGQGSAATMLCALTGAAVRHLRLRRRAPHVQVAVVDGGKGPQ